MKLFITGGAGFIGSNFVCYWLNKHSKDQILVLDKLTYAGDLDNLKDVQNNPSYSFKQGDICNKSLVKKLLLDFKPDVIVHFAAESHVTRSEFNKDIFYKTNILGTKNLLENAKQAKIKKFIHISTDEVYGEIKRGYFKETDKRINDNKATSDYAKSKAKADDIAMKYSKLINVVVVRPTNNFGPKQYPEKALPRWITNLILNKKIEIWGDGKQIRDWLYVLDTCKALEIIIKKGKSGNAYNIGANNKPEIENIQAAKLLIKVMQKNENMIKLIPDPRKHHDFRYGVDTNKVSKLGWIPSKDIDRSFVDTVNWYKQNTKWWKKHKAEAEKIYK
ncbi:dTDP-glucose 4,6-dehydratase [Patescibacteria group bacterium]